MHHRIRAGETLTAVAARYGTTVERLAEANGIRNPNQILAGQRLQIPTEERRSADRRERFNPRQNVRERFGMGEGQVDRRRGERRATESAAATTAQPATASETTGARAERGAGKDIKLEVPYFSQLVPGNGFRAGRKSCYLAARAMAGAAGARVQGPGDRIQVATSEHRDGSIEINPQNARRGRDYIDQQLEAGKPVVVGVSHKDARYNVDGITDHFVVITGRGSDSNGTYYTFHDPASRSASRGSDENPDNRFRADGDGMLFKEGSRARGWVLGRRFEVSMVRRNA